MSEYDSRVSATHGRHRFTISTKFMKDYGIETPVSGATQIVAARGDAGRLEVFSIGSDQHLHHFSRGISKHGSGTGRAARSRAARRRGSEWTRVRLPWKASSLAVVAQRNGTDKVFFAELDGFSGKTVTGEKAVTDEKAVTVYEVEHAGREPQRRLLGRFATTDPKVYGLGPLSGAQCRDGSNILVTALAAASVDEAANWVVLFGHRSSTGALSLEEGKGVVADRVKVAGEDPGATRWPHMTFVLLRGGRLRVEWGARNGVLLQSERLAIPELGGVADYDVVRDHRGYLKIFALDRDRNLHVLCQAGGGGARPPRWASSWLRLDCTQSDGSRPRLRTVQVLRRTDGDIEVFALDESDRLWSISEKPEGSADGWGRLQGLGIHAAHVTVASPRNNSVEVFAVSRQNQLLWLRRDRQESWRLEKVGWDAAASHMSVLNVYRTGLTIFGEGDEAVSGVPVSITATERLPSTVNGLSYAIGPSEPVRAETNAFGKVSVTFETAEKRSVPSLSFEAGFLAGGLLDVCPERKAHIYVPGIEDETLRSVADPRRRMYLIPENTVIEQA